ncbi:MAG TPA: TraB/GumN family protein [Gammaproteobacteria bacterium]|nr:TraB/GumN family protein [Gammaproteobacteria bacterium]
MRKTTPVLPRARCARRLCGGIVLALIALTSAAEPPEEFTVTGRYPGPPLWKVSRGTHELWIFGTLSVIPKDITWGSVIVERVIGRADAVLRPPGVDAWARNPFRYPALFFRARKLSRNSEGATLSEVLPAEIYARYAAIRDRYDAPRNLEQQRPAIVAGRLFARAIDAAGLSSGRKLQDSIEKLARGARVKTIDTEIRADPGELLDAAEALSRQAEVDCFATVLASIENDMPGIAERARAWAVGDITAMRRFDYPDIEGECLSFAGTSAGLRETLNKAEDAWLEAAERALAANQTTFATLSVGDLLRSDGALARLRERGYDVHEP